MFALLNGSCEGLILLFLERVVRHAHLAILSACCSLPRSWNIVATNAELTLATNFQTAGVALIAAANMADDLTVSLLSELARSQRNGAC